MNRDDFKMLGKELIYFDNGATTLKPNSVIESIVDYYENYSANAHRGDYDISLKVDETYENVRNKVKDFINANYELNKDNQYQKKIFLYQVEIKNNYIVKLLEQSIDNTAYSLFSINYEKKNEISQFKTL